MKKIILFLFALLISSPSFAECHNTIAGVGDVPCTEEEIDEKAAADAQWLIDLKKRKAVIDLEQKKEEQRKQAPDILVKAIDALEKGQPLPDDVKEYVRKMKRHESAGSQGLRDRTEKRP